uniref:DUF1493 family protein n=1 Tax=Salmonella enterica TaxID=28901 RepID=UPI00398C5DB1
NTYLSIDELEAGDVMNKFFEELNVERGTFRIETYFPNHPFSWHPFKKTEPAPGHDFTIRLLIESAKAGKLLYD